MAGPFEEPFVGGEGTLLEAWDSVTAAIGGPPVDGTEVDGSHPTEVDKEPSPPVDQHVILIYISDQTYHDTNIDEEEETEQYSENVFRMASMEVDLDAIATPITSHFKDFESTAMGQGHERYHDHACRSKQIAAKLGRPGHRRGSTE